MNVLLVCDKQEVKSYEAVIKTAPNTNLLGAIIDIGDNFINDIEKLWTPHTIIFVNGVKYSDGCNLLSTIQAIRQNYPYIQILYIHGNENNAKNIIDELAELNIYTVVTRNITNLEFNELLMFPLKSIEDAEKFNKKEIKTQEKKKKDLSNIKPFILPAVILFSLIIFIIVVLIIKNSTTNSQDKEKIDITTPTEKITQIQTQPLTQPITQKPTTIDSLSSSRPNTDPQTEKPTEKPTNAPEEKTSPPAANSNKPSNNNNGSNNTGNISNENTNNQKPQQNNNNQQNNNHNNNTNSNNTPAPPANNNNDNNVITDDGKIHFDKSEYKVKSGEQFEIKVTGLSASRGCDWTLDNNAIVKFISADTTKVTLQALSSGTTTVTAKAKSNGTTRQVLIIVE